MEGQLCISLAIQSQMSVGFLLEDGGATLYFPSNSISDECWILTTAKWKESLDWIAVPAPTK
jgi:hypothetical protein